MSESNRRRTPRVPVRIFLSDINDERPSRGLAANLSEEGLYVDQLADQPLEQDASMDIEFSLPGSDDTICARGNVRYERSDRYFRGAGIQFTSIMDHHRELIREYVAAYQLRQLRRIRASIQRNRVN